ncbi:MAG: DUF4178 domain-containing protein [Cocleimonas sp.]|nr:DUF4178 domain-containing protein [Cocleimonas sp.]
MNCPQCSSEIILKSSLAALVNCHHCASTLLIESNGLALSHIESHIENKLSLIKQGESFSWKEQQFEPQGFVQLKHDEGYRKEWWVLDNQKNSHWLSEEDENFFLLQDRQINEGIPPWLTLQVNTQLQLADKTWLVTERRAQNFHGFQGQISYLPRHTETLNYTYLTGEDAESLVLVFEGEQIRCRQGFWLDPFEIKAI